MIQGKDVIYLFFGDVSKLLEWMKARRGRLRFAVYDLEKPPVRFIIFATTDAVPNRDLLILPVAPFPNRSLDLILAGTPKDSVDVITGSPRRRKDVERFARYFVFAPTT